MSEPCGRRLRWLVAAHLGLGIVARLLAPIEVRTPFGLEHILLVPFFASTLAQAFLLAVWGAASPAPSWVRLAGLVAGAIYLEALFPGDLRREFLGICTLTIAVASASLLVVRWIGLCLNRRADPGRLARPEAGGPRFSIRGLMLFTAAVALLSAGARALRETPTHFLILTAVWGLCFVSVGLVSVWAALGRARPAWRSPVVLILSPVLGAFFALAADAQRAEWVYIILTMLLYAAALLGSLLVVRSCGYRLVGRRTPTPDATDGRSEGEPTTGHKTVVVTTTK